MQRYSVDDWAECFHKTKADIAADLNIALPIESEMAGTGVSIPVMEHLCEPPMMLNEACRIVKQGGELVFQVPWQWWTHESPYGHSRYTSYGLKFIVKRAGLVEVSVATTFSVFTMWLVKLNVSAQDLSVARGCCAGLSGPYCCLFGIWTKRPHLI